MRKNLTKLLSIIILVIGISICTSSATFSKNFEKVNNIPKGAALIYLYRPFKITGLVMPFSIGLGEYPSELIFSLNNEDDRLIVNLPNDTYYPIFVKPGKICFFGIENILRLNVKEGQTYYLEAAMKYEIELLLVPPEEGKKKIQKCKLKIN